MKKRRYYNNLDLKVFGNNKKFWLFIRPLFSDKQKLLQKNILLRVNDELISDKEIDKLNNIFIETVGNLDIERFAANSNSDINLKNIEEIIIVYALHPSIVKINENITVENKFSFNEITPELFTKQLLDLNPKKSRKNDIPVKALVNFSDIASEYLCNILNKSFQSNIFPHSLKLADVIP